VIDHQPRRRVVTRRQREQSIAVDDAVEPGERLPHEERALLPVAAKEGRGRHPAEDGGHAGILVRRVSERPVYTRAVAPSGIFTAMFLDAGQGDCTLVKYPDDTLLLVDCGCIKNGVKVSKKIREVLTREINASATSDRSPAANPGSTARRTPPIHRPSIGSNATDRPA
jgi:hypothetical protein